MTRENKQAVKILTPERSRKWVERMLEYTHPPKLYDL
jgi:hypothetical protein